MAIEFTLAEVNRLQKNPEALRACANDHMILSLEADSIGGCEESVKFHDAREAELIAHAVLIEADL